MTMFVIYVVLATPLFLFGLVMGTEGLTEALGRPTRNLLDVVDAEHPVRYVFTVFLLVLLCVVYFGVLVALAILAGFG